METYERNTASDQSMNGYELICVYVCFVFFSDLAHKKPAGRFLLSPIQITNGNMQNNSDRRSNNENRSV